MSEQIKKSDISEKDVFGYLIDGSKIALDSITKMNNALIESAKLSKESLKGNKLSNTAELKDAENQIKLLNFQVKEKIKLDNEIIKLSAQKVNAETQYNKAVERSNREEAKKIQQQERLTSAYSRVNSWLGKLRAEYRNLAIRQELNGKLTDAEIKRMTILEGRINQFSNSLVRTDEKMGLHTRKVGNYANAWNGLGNSVNQLTREMPAFAISAQTGMMAISNNLPIFFDEIAKIRTQNKQLRADGQPTVSMFKQMAGAIFSVGSVLSIGVTLLTVYGAELLNVAFGLEDATEKQNKFNEAIKRGNDFAQLSIEQIDEKRAYDQMTTKEAIARIKAEIQMADERRKTLSQEAKETKKRLDEQNWLNIYYSYSEEQRLKARLKAKQEDKTSEEETIRVLKEKLKQLKLEDYQEGKANKNKSESTKRREKETKVIEYQVKALERLNEVNRVAFADVDVIDEALLKRAKTEQDVYLMMAELTKNEKLIREARITKIKADLKIELDSIEARKKAYEEMRKINPNLKADFETSDAYITKLTLEAQLQIQDLEKESNKKRYENFRDYTDLITEYAIKKSNQRIEQIEKESQSAQKNYDLLVELAKNGNIQAQQSLAQEQKNLIEANKKKEQELKKQEFIKLGTTAIDTFSNKVANNDKQPLLSTIKDITLLRAFISTLASYDVGTEKTFDSNGSGIDGKGGRMAIVHANEKIFTEEHSKKIGFDISNNEVADVISMYKQGVLVPISKMGAFAGNSYDLKPLLKEVQELKEVIKNQPQTNLEVGRITRDLYEFGQRTVQGNKTTIDKYQIRRR